tara:strand:+ start:692 stop:2044 length:1353 start_codon:yes stop_codon:yes gene_type:complete
MPNFFINVKEKGAKKAEKNIKGLNGALGGLASKAKLAAGAFVTGGLLVGMKKAVELAAEQELQEKKLSQALGKNTDALLKQAGALQQASRFGDEAIIQQQAYLASIGMSEQQIKEMIPVTLDLAAATGMSLESAVKNTAKTLSGMTGELGESVGALKELSAEQLKAGEGIEVMREMFKGAAETETKTFSGALDQMKNALGDAAEVIGSILIPILTPLIKGITKLATGFVSVTGSIGGFLSSFGKSKEEINESLTPLQIFTKAQQDLSLAIMKVNYPKIAVDMKKVKESQIDIASATKLAREEREKDLASTVAGNNTLLGVMRSQIQAKFATMIAGLLEKEIGSKGLFGLAIAPIVAAGASQLFNKLVPSFATGGDFITNGPQMIMVGDNASQRERVQITPLGADPMSGGGSGSSVTVNVSGNVMSKDFVEGELADQIKNAIRRGTDFGLS